MSFVSLHFSLYILPKALCNQDLCFLRIFMAASLTKEIITQSCLLSNGLHYVLCSQTQSTTLHGKDNLVPLTIEKHWIKLLLSEVKHWLKYLLPFFFIFSFFICLWLIDDLIYMISFLLLNLNCHKNEMKKIHEYTVWTRKYISFRERFENMFYFLFLKKFT